MCKISFKQKFKGRCELKTAFTWRYEAAKNMPKKITSQESLPLHLSFHRLSPSFSSGTALPTPITSAVLGLFSSYFSSCLSPSAHPFFSCLFYCSASSLVFRVFFFSSFQVISDPTKMTKHCAHLSLLQVKNRA